MPNMSAPAGQFLRPEAQPPAAVQPATSVPAKPDAPAYVGKMPTQDWVNSTAQRFGVNVQPRMSSAQQNGAADPYAAAREGGVPHPQAWLPQQFPENPYLRDSLRFNPSFTPQSGNRYVAPGLDTSHIQNMPGIGGMLEDLAWKYLTNSPVGGDASDPYSSGNPYTTGASPFSSDNSSWLLPEMRHAAQAANNGLMTYYGMPPSMFQAGLGGLLQQGGYRGF